jgi:hypothetical protein
MRQILPVALLLTALPTLAQDVPIRVAITEQDPAQQNLTSFDGVFLDESGRVYLNAVSLDVGPGVFEEFAGEVSAVVTNQQSTLTIDGEAADYQDARVIAARGGRLLMTGLLTPPGGAQEERVVLYTTADQAGIALPAGYVPFALNENGTSFGLSNGQNAIHDEFGLAIVVVEGEDVPGESGTVFQNAQFAGLLDNDTLLFNSGTLPTSGSEGYWVWNDGVIEPFLIQRNTAVGGDAPLTGFFSPTVGRAGALVVKGTPEGLDQPRGVYLYRSSPPLERIHVNDLNAQGEINPRPDPAPGFDSPLAAELDNAYFGAGDTIAISGRVYDPDNAVTVDTALWVISPENNAFTLVASSQDTAPNGGTFQIDTSNLAQTIVAGDRLFFRGGTGADDGIWVFEGGALSLVQLIGQPIGDGGTLDFTVDFPISETFVNDRGTGFNRSGTIAFQAIVGGDDAVVVIGQDVDDNSADLSVTGTAESDGPDLELVLTLANAGPDDVLDFEVVITATDGIVPAGDPPADCVHEVSGTTFTQTVCELSAAVTPAIPAGGDREITISYIDNAPEDASFVAEISSETADPDPTNNRVEIDVVEAEQTGLIVEPEGFFLVPGDSFELRVRDQNECELTVQATPSDDWEEAGVPRDDGPILTIAPEGLQQGTAFVFTVTADEGPEPGSDDVWVTTVNVVAEGNPGSGASCDYSDSEEVRVVIRNQDDGCAGCSSAGLAEAPLVMFLVYFLSPRRRRRSR